MASPARTSPLRGSRGRTVARPPVRLFGFISVFRISVFRIFPKASSRRHLCSCRWPVALPPPSIGPLPPASVTDSPAFRPLHSLTHPLPAADCSHSFRRPQTGETAKDPADAPEKQWWSIRHGSRRAASFPPKRGALVTCMLSPEKTVDAPVFSAKVELTHESNHASHPGAGTVVGPRSSFARQ